MSGCSHLPIKESVSWIPISKELQVVSVCVRKRESNSVCVCERENLMYLRDRDSNYKVGENGILNYVDK